MSLTQKSTRIISWLAGKIVLLSWVLIAGDASAALRWEIRTHAECGYEFSVLEPKIDDEQTRIEYEPVSDLQNRFLIALPRVEVESNSLVKINRSDSEKIQLQNPLFPIIPTSIDYQPKSQKRCEFLGFYIKQISSKLIEIKNDHASYKLSLGGSELEIRPVQSSQSLKSTARAPVQTKANLKYPVFSPGTSFPLLVITTQSYLPEMKRLALHRKVEDGMRVAIVTVDKLPGFRAQDPTPIDCEGPYLKECYHHYDDRLDYVHPLAVPSLMGFHQETRITQKYSRVSFIPGLIRARIRQAVREWGGLSGVLLVGDPYVISPIFTPKVDYSFSGREGWSRELAIGVPGEDHLEYVSGSARMSLGTDLYFSLPQFPLTPMPAPNFTPLYPIQVACTRDGTTFTQRTWCQPGERRYRPDEMKNYAWQTHVPWTRTFNDPISEYRQFVLFKAPPKDQMIPVGRLPTRERLLKSKDPMVARYVDKLIRYEKNLPDFRKDAVLVHGGNDSWIGFDHDNFEFYKNFGPDSKIIVSRPLMPFMSSTCSRCEFKNGKELFSGMRGKNYSALYMNGHGARTGLQAPYDAWTPSSYESFNVNYSTWIGELDQLIVSTEPRIAPWSLLGTENKVFFLSRRSFPLKTGALIGQVVANSCNPSQYFMPSLGDIEILKANPRHEVLSAAEDLLRAEGGGAINTYMNQFVGWILFDNLFNQKLMKTTEEAWLSCERSGSAMTRIYDEVFRLKNYSHQILLRAFLGDPTAKIALPAEGCRVYGAKKDAKKTPNRAPASVVESPGAVPVQAKEPSKK